MLTKRFIPVPVALYPTGASGTSIIDGDTFDALFTSGVPNTSGHYLPEGAMIVVDAVTKEIFQEDGTTSATKSGKYFFAWNKGGVIYTSPIIDKSYRTAFTKSTYAAAVAKVIKLGYNSASGDLTFPASPVEGDTIGVRIIDLTKESWNGKREIYKSYTMKSGDTRSGALTNLVSLINADTNKICTAVALSSGSNLGLQLTSDTAGNDFTAIMEDDAIDSALTVATANTIGTGTLAEVQALEKECSVAEGNSNTNAGNIDTFSFSSGLGSATTFTQYVTVVKMYGGSSEGLESNEKIQWEINLAGISTSGSGNFTAVMDALIAAAVI